MAFFIGIQFFFRGIRLSLSSDIRRLMLIPVGLSFIIVSLGLWLVFGWATALADEFVSSLPAWLAFIEWILAPLLYLSGILIGTWCFGLLAAIIGSPFLGEIAQRIDDPAPPSTSFWQDLGPTVQRELRKITYHAPRIAGLVVVGFIPVLAAFAPALWLGFGAWIMAVQFCDFTCEHRGLDFQKTIALLRANRSAAIGFGLCVTLALAVPLINLLIPTIAVTGATLMLKKLLQTQT